MLVGIFAQKGQRTLAAMYCTAAYEWKLRRLGNAVTEYAGEFCLSDGFSMSTGKIMADRPRTQ